MFKSILSELYPLHFYFFISILLIDKYCCKHCMGKKCLYLTNQIPLASDSSKRHFKGQPL